MADADIAEAARDSAAYTRATQPPAKSKLPWGWIALAALAWLATSRGRR